MVTWVWDRAQTLLARRAFNQLGNFHNLSAKVDGQIYPSPLLWHGPVPAWGCQVWGCWIWVSQRYGFTVYVSWRKILVIVGFCECACSRYFFIRVGWCIRKQNIFWFKSPSKQNNWFCLDSGCIQWCVSFQVRLMLARGLFEPLHIRRDFRVKRRCSLLWLPISSCFGLFTFLSCVASPSFWGISLRLYFHRSLEAPVHNQIRSRLSPRRYSDFFSEFQDRS